MKHILKQFGATTYLSIDTDNSYKTLKKSQNGQEKVSIMMYCCGPRKFHHRPRRICQKLGRASFLTNYSVISLPHKNTSQWLLLLSLLDSQVTTYLSLTLVNVTLSITQVQLQNILNAPHSLHVTAFYVCCTSD